MPNIQAKANGLERRFYNEMRKTDPDRAKVKEVIDIYRRGTHVNFRTAENTVLALYSPFLFGKRKAERMYKDFVSAYGNPEDIVPNGLARARRANLRLEEQLGRLRGAKKTYDLHVMLYTSEEKLDMTRDRIPANGEAIVRRKLKKHRGLVQYWKGDLTVNCLLYTSPSPRDS